jgi:hypothetical protein
MSVELGILDEIKTRVRLARKIDTVQHKAKKTNHDRKWMRETAEVLGVDLDSDMARCACPPLPFPSLSILFWIPLALIYFGKFGAVIPRTKLLDLDGE